jgi:phage major head subunit gpT-like protein
MAPITTGNFPKALLPGVKDWFGAEYKQLPSFWDKIFTVVDSDSNYEEYVETTGLGLAVVKPEGASITYDSHQQGPTTRINNTVYALGFIITEEAIDDGKYMKLTRIRSRMLARAMRQTKEIVHANVLNRAFNSSYVGGDGKELIATDHPSLAGTWSNELTVAADLSEASLEDLATQMSLAVDGRGHHYAIGPKTLVVHPANQFEAYRILKSVGRVGSSDNDINAIKAMGLFSGGVIVNPFLTDPDAWFVLSDLSGDNGLISQKRKEMRVRDDNDFDTSNAKFKADERYGVGWGDPRVIWGSAGA